jgi:biopolymer transport protein ExbD
MIPLIDVMLVLLVIFIITAPLLTHSVKIDLPKASSHPNLTKPDNIQLAVDAQGTVYWNGQTLGRADWRAHMADAAAHKPQPEVHIRADGAVAYRKVAEVMSDAASAGLTRIGFVTEPEHQ